MEVYCFRKIINDNWALEEHSRRTFHTFNLWNPTLKQDLWLLVLTPHVNSNSTAERVKCETLMLVESYGSLPSNRHPVRKWLALQPRIRWKPGRSWTTVNKNGWVDRVGRWNAPGISWKYVSRSWISMNKRLMDWMTNLTRVKKKLKLWKIAELSGMQNHRPELFSWLKKIKTRDKSLFKAAAR